MKLRHSLLILTVAASPAVTGCSALFAGATVATVTADVSAFVTAADLASSAAADVWALLPPNVQSEAASVYTDLQNGLKNTIAVIVAALSGYTAGASPTPDWAKLTAAVTSAIDAIVAEVESLQSPPAAPGTAKVALLSPQAAGRLAQLKSVQASAHAFRINQ